MKLTIKLLVVIILLSGCEKFLDEKANKADLVPTTLGELEGMMDRSFSINQGPGLLEELSDNYYYDLNPWLSLVSMGYGGSYTWSEDASSQQILADWRIIYQYPIYTANMVLDLLPTVSNSGGNIRKGDAVKGTALFFRGIGFFAAAQLFSLPYATENLSQPGIVIRLSADVSLKSSRSTVAEAYNQILKDLNDAALLLPENVEFPTRPSKVAVYAALARVHLSMRDYENAKRYADLALESNSVLVDYNTLFPLQSPIFAMFNPEVIFQNVSNPIAFQIGQAKIDSVLYKSYDDHDLRKTVFFYENAGDGTGTYSFRGSYDGYAGILVFDGFTTSELYLIRAECLAREGNIPAALSDLNTLMKSRWDKNVNYPEITAVNGNDALNKILIERRKELVYRGQRWSDIRRLNLEGANITLGRVLDGATYTLPPNDLRSVLLIPQDEINRSGIAQNPR